MTTGEVTQRAQLAALLCEDTVANAFALGYLDASYAEACTWHGHRDSQGVLRSAVLLYRGLSRPALFTAGRREGIKPIVRDLRDGLPDRCIGHVGLDHRDAVSSAFDTSGLHRVSRMALPRARFSDPGHSGAQVDVLTHRDTAQILQLYALWPDSFFEPYQLESGLYFGVRAEDGTVASIAGVHNVSDTYDVAAIGNLVTHPDYRGRGFAAACTASLLRAVFERVGLVTLDVEEANEPAVRTYRRFGFEPAGDFYEGALTRR